MGEPWMRWAVFEGWTKAFGRLFAKFIGVTGQSLGGALAATVVAGVVQFVGGLIGARVRRESIVPTFPQIIGGIAFGLIATAMVTLAVFSFTFPGADIGITTFIVTMSIVPGALIDWVFFRRPLVIRQWLGVAVFLFGGYAVLNFPPVGAIFALPPWVWLTVVISLLAAVNEGITQAVRAMDPLVNNVWVGLTMAATGTLALILAGEWESAGRLPVSFWLIAVLAGANALAGVVAKLLAYKGGGSIALKKLIMQGTYLITATLLGALFYAESFTAGKMVGIAGFVFAFTLMDQSTWEFFRRKYFPASVIAR